MKRIKKVDVLINAKEYCKENKLSFDKLDKQHFQVVENTCYFLQANEVKPDGLRNDLDTQQFPTLIVEIQDKDFKFIQTEHTQKYLSN